MRSPMSFFLFSIFLFPPMDASSQAPVSSPELASDRPDRTESSLVLPKGFIQMESGWNLSRSSTDPCTATVHQFPDTLVRIGFLKRAEGRIAWTGGTWQTTAGANGGLRSSGIGDLEVGTKLFLRGQKGWLPETSVIAGTVLPTGSGWISSGRIDPSLRLAMSNGLSENVSVGYNIAISWQTGKTPSGARDTVAVAEYSTSLGVGLGKRAGLFFEFFGSSPVNAGGGPANALDAGLTFLALGNLQFDCSGGFGTSRASDDWFAGAGVVWRLPR